MEVETKPAAAQPAAQQPTSAQPPPANSAAPAAPALPPPGEEYKSMTPEAFRARLADAEAAGEKRLLKALGVEKLEDVKGAFAKLKDIENANLTATERMKKQLEELTPKAARADALLPIVEMHAKLEFDRLPPALQKYVQSIAGDDPAARLRAINAARESGVFDALTKSTAASEDAAKKAADAAKPLANSRAGTTPPAPAGPTPAKLPRDMTEAEFRQYQAERRARLGQTQ
jgi:hypothetical protein